MSPRLLRPLFLTLLASLPLLAPAEPPATEGWPLVESKMRLEHDWTARPTRELASLADFTPPPAVELTRWGGWQGLRLDEGTGFFRVGRAASGRWWLIDPDGHAFLHIGVAGVYQGPTPIAAQTTRERFATPDAWATAALDLLREHGFNGLGGWTERDVFHARADALPYTVSLNFLAQFGRHLGITHLNPGQTGYLNEVPPVLHPDFPAWAETFAAAHVAPLAGDPFLLGIFSDNEIPFRRTILDGSLALPSDQPAVAPLRQAALDWLAGHRGPGADLARPTTEDEQIAFLGLVVERYYALVAAALRRHAPDRLYLGSRLHGRILRFPEVLQAAGRHADVISINYYHAWAPDPALLDFWQDTSGRPVMITEFYAKGMDTGMENRRGAGWIVPRQEDRGRFYQHFVLGLLEHGSVVGWHWFKYRDNEPFDTAVMASNRDVNKGLLAWDYTPYPPLLARMRALHASVYPLTGYFDRRGQP
jgi:hypothetical protein